MVMLLIVIGSALWVYLDAKSIGVHKGLIPGFFDLGSGGWCAATLILWIICFPAYLIKRGALKTAAAAAGGYAKEISCLVSADSAAQTAAASEAFGSSQNIATFCSKCGATLASGAKYCTGCGTKVISRATVGRLDAAAAPLQRGNSTDKSARTHSTTGTLMGAVTNSQQHLSGRQALKIVVGMLLICGIGGVLLAVLSDRTSQPGNPTNQSASAAVPTASLASVQTSPSIATALVGEWSCRDDNGRITRERYSSDGTLFWQIEAKPNGEAPMDRATTKLDGTYEVSGNKLSFSMTRMRMEIAPEDVASVGNSEIDTAMQGSGGSAIISMDGNRMQFRTISHIKNGVESSRDSAPYMCSPVGR